MTLPLRLKFIIDPTPELTDFIRGDSVLVEFRYAHARRHCVLMVGATNDRWIGNQAKRAESGSGLLNSCRARWALSNRT